MLKKLSIVVFSVMLLSMFVPGAIAQESKIGLVISPSLREAKVSPGDKYSDVVKVTNPTESNLTVDVSVQNFLAQNEEGDKKFLDATETTTYELAKWITVEKKFTLKPNETKEVNYSINAPANAEPGGHYAVLLFSPKLEKPADVAGSGALIESKIGTTLLVTVPGNLTYGAKIAEFSTSKNLFTDSTNSIDLVTRFQNLSSVHVKPQGSIVIKNVLGSTVASLVVNENQNNVLPDSIRKFTNNWEKKSGFGPYRATISLNYGDGKTVASELSFWIIPWKETLGVIVIIIVLIWILSRLQWKK